MKKTKEQKKVEKRAKEYRIMLEELLSINVINLNDYYKIIAKLNEKYLTK